jgi:CheY-like chemotaxis protein
VSRPPRAIAKQFVYSRIHSEPVVRPLLLCIEDDPIYLLLRKAVLERNGYDVIGVTSADDAVLTLRETPVCCVIADHMLRGSTGVEVAKEMKRIKADVPIVIYSGTIPAGMQAIDVYINKGEPTATFLSIIRDLVNRSCQ